MFWNEKTHFQGIKTRSSKSRKVAIFVKGLTHGFGTKMAIFAASFFFGKIGQENVFFDILKRKKAFLGYKNKKIKKSKNCHFSKGVNPWFWFKNGNFFNFFWRGKTGQENVFQDILERKKTFLDFKNKKFKKSKNCHFSKRVNPWFWSKNGHFFNFFFLGKIGQENVFYDILERKNAFLGYKNKTLKKSQNCYFSKGVIPWFLDRNGNFCSFFFFRQNRPGKCLLRYSSTKKRLSWL